MGSNGRREFCGQACRAASLAAVGGALTALAQGCGGSGGNPSSPSSAVSLPVVTGTVSGATVTLAIDASSPLAAVGSAALVQTSNGRLLVAHTGQGTFTALSATCTHEGCTITGYGSQTFVCPCHGAQYDTSGHVTRGPATRPLPQYATSFVDNVLTISA